MGVEFDQSGEVRAEVDFGLGKTARRFRLSGFEFGFDDFAIGPDADDRRAFRRTFDGDVVFGGFGKDDDEAFFELNGGDGWL